MCIGSEGLLAHRPTNPDSRPAERRAPVRDFVIVTRQKTEGSTQRRSEHPTASRESRPS